VNTPTYIAHIGYYYILLLNVLTAKSKRKSIYLYTSSPIKSYGGNISEQNKKKDMKKGNRKRENSEEGRAAKPFWPGQPKREKKGGMK